MVLQHTAKINLFANKKETSLPGLVKLCKKISLLLEW